MSFPSSFLRVLSFIHELNPTTHIITDFHTNEPFVTGLAPGPDGNLWFLEPLKKNVAELNLTTHVITELPIPTGVGGAANAETPWAMAPGPNGTLWFTVRSQHSNDQIGLVAAPTTVTALQRIGVHDQPTSVVITFSEPLDPSSAQNASNYTIVGPRGKHIAVDAAVYNATNDTVTLHPHHRLNVHYTYHLVVNGSTPGAETDVNGFWIDGAGTGQSGTNYTATISRKNLVLPLHYPHARIARKSAHAVSVKADSR